MKIQFSAIALTVMSLSSVPAKAQINGDDDVMAARGKGTVTHERFEARAHRIPAEHRFQVIRDTNRMEDMLENLLMVNQLAVDAREAGFDQDPIVLERMNLAAEEELAKAWMERYIDNAREADYTAMAREEYQLHRDQYVTQPTIDVSHILIKTEDRSDEEALDLIETLRQQLLEDPARFEELVMAYSEDPSKAGNKGSFGDVRKGDMTENFERVAFELPVGELSGPVESPYGYHLIRKDGQTPARQRKFNEVRLSLESQMRKRHRDRVRQEYLQEIYSPEMLVTKESVENSIERVFGPEVLAREAESGNSK